jgi:two-component system, sensor histidine kinase
MFRDPQPSRRDVRRLLALAALVVVLVTMAGAALLAFASNAVDQLQAQEERALVERTLKRFERRLASDLTTATVWDQAYRQLLPGGDLRWADAEIGTYFTNNRGHDLTLVFDGSDRPFYGYTHKGRVGPDAMKPFQADVAPLLRELRRKEQTQVLPGARQAPTDPDLAVRAHGVLRSGGVYYLVVGSTVTPEVWGAPRRPGPSVVVISAQRMDRAFLATLKEELRVRDAAITGTLHDGEGLPLVDINGRRVGALVWQAKQPGISVLRQAAPTIAAGFMVLLAAALALAARMAVIIRRLDANERRLSLAVADLMRARDAAQSASRAKSEFLANMSHEIRTPLNGVLGMAQVMARHPLAPDQAERLEVIRAGGESLLSVLNSVLDISKIEAGRLDLERRPFDLAEAVHAACDAFAAQARQKDLTFEMDIAPAALGAWIGDVVRVRQVLANLVSNAVKFTSRGQVAVRVEATGHGLAFQVSDSGVGVPPEHLPRLFEKFSQADSSTTRRFGGTGLGLAISRELVELMGGTVTAASVLGEGSTFTFELPIERSTQVAERMTAAAEREAGPRGPLTILAAEDNPTNRLILSALLEPLDVDLMLAENGVEAVAACDRRRFDVILMDAQMPEMNGLEAARAIRLLEVRRGLARTPIIALTANVMSHQIETYLAAGMDGCVAKPIDSAKLLQAIDEALSARSADAA